MLPNAQPCILIAYVSSKVKYVVREAVLEILGDNSQECSWYRDKSVLLQGEWVHVTGAEHLLESLSPSQHSKSWPESFPPMYMHAGHSITWETSTKLSFLLMVSLPTFWRPHYTLLSFWALVLLIYSLAASPSPAGWSRGCAVKQRAVDRLVGQPYIETATIAFPIGNAIVSMYGWPSSHNITSNSVLCSIMYYFASISVPFLVMLTHYGFWSLHHKTDMFSTLSAADGNISLALGF